MRSLTGQFTLPRSFDPTMIVPAMSLLHQELVFNVASLAVLDQVHRDGGTEPSSP